MGRLVLSVLMLTSIQAFANSSGVTQIEPLMYSMLRSGFGLHFSNSFSHFIEARKDLHLKTETADAALVWLKTTTPEDRRRAVDRLAHLLKAYDFYLVSNGPAAVDLLERLEVERDWRRNLSVLAESPLSAYRAVVPALSVVYFEFEGLSDVETIRMFRLANRLLEAPPARKLIFFFGGGTSSPIVNRFLFDGRFFTSKVFDYTWTDIIPKAQCEENLTD